MSKFGGIAVVAAASVIAIGIGISVVVHEKAVSEAKRCADYYVKYNDLIAEIDAKDRNAALLTGVDFMKAEELSLLASVRSKQADAVEMGCRANRDSFDDKLRRFGQNPDGVCEDAPADLRAKAREYAQRADEKAKGADDQRRQSSAALGDSAPALAGDAPDATSVSSSAPVFTMTKPGADERAVNQATAETQRSYRALYAAQQAYAAQHQAEQQQIQEERQRYAGKMQGLQRSGYGQNPQDGGWNHSTGQRDAHGTDGTDPALGYGRYSSGL